MSDAFVIETARHTAGIAVRERSGFRFYASEALFQPLDSRVFRSLQSVRAAVNAITAPAVAKRSRPAPAELSLVGDFS